MPVKQDFENKTTSSYQLLKIEFLDFSDSLIHSCTVLYKPVNC